MRAKFSSPEYRAWSSMRTRCRNPRARQWPNYGGRGISICPAWDSFDRFIGDMGPRPSPAHSLDRIDNNGNYEPTNCRWATKREQSLNRRSRTQIELNGQLVSAGMAAELLGLDYSGRQRIAAARVRKAKMRGHDVVAALRAPVVAKRLIDMVGRRFGRWTVQERGPSNSSNARWWCVCVCGSRRVIAGGKLRNGRSVGCGCHRRQTRAA